MFEKWNFPSVKTIGIEGLNNVGEVFKDDRLASLAKEICQNSLDTRFDDDYGKYCKKEEKITIEFEEFYIKPKSIPDFKGYCSFIEEEYKFNSGYYKNDKTVPEYYKNAMDILNKDLIKCLRISDFNTTGLKGAKSESSESNWSNLTKNSGVSDKVAGSAGSKGEGKFTSFVCSDLSTVFYSTLAIDGNKAYTGICRLSGFKKAKSDEYYLGKGFFEDNGKPIFNVLNLDNNYKRTEYGTDIFIIGFIDDNKWKQKIIGSVINNFFYSLFKNDLEVKVCGEIINSFSLRQHIEANEFVTKRTKKYYQLLIEPIKNLKCFTHTMFEENDLKLIILEDKDKEGFNRVAAIRATGMKILDIDHLPSLGVYNGILFMNGTKVNDYFRKIENAQHTNWSSDRAANKKEASEKIDELKRFIKNSIKTIFAINHDEEIDAEGVGEFLPDEDLGSNPNKEESIFDGEIRKISEIKKKSEKLKIKENKKKKRRRSVVPPQPPKPPKPPKPQPPVPPLPKPKELGNPIDPIKLRLINTGKTYRLIGMFSEEKVKLRFYVVDDEYEEQVTIRNLKTKEKVLEIKENMSEVVLEEIKNVEFQIEFEINSDGIWNLEVRAYGE